MSGNNVTLLSDFSAQGERSGWKNAEEELLWQEVRKAREEGRSLKSVFEAVALSTGRKPNSIRNHYYVRVRESPDSEHCPAFVPFEENEVRDLLTTVLTEQAKGVSVRACTLKMGNGDTRAMLRFQNKYRATVKNRPELVMQIIEELRAMGVPCVDPYEKKPRRRVLATECGADIVASVAELVRAAGEVREAKRRISELEATVERLQNERDALLRERPSC